MTDLRVEHAVADPHRQPQARFGLTFFLGLGSFVLFTADQVLAMNASEWFDVDPRNAAHNFWFNLTFFFPLMLLGSVLAATSLVLYFRSLVAAARAGRLTVRQAAAILPTLPVLGMDLILFTQFVAASLLAS